MTQANKTAGFPAFTPRNCRKEAQASHTDLLDLERLLNDHADLPWNIPHQVKMRVRLSRENHFNII